MNPRMPQRFATRLIVLFAVCLMGLVLILSLWSLYRERTTERFTADLERFKSDFFTQTEGRELFEDIILPKNRFIAYGSYLDIPQGFYQATFQLDSSSVQPVSLVLQIAVDKGKSVIVSHSITLEDFPVQKEIQFKVRTTEEIEPRVLYQSGNSQIILEKVMVEQIRGGIPWLSIIQRALFYAFLCTLILSAFSLTRENSDTWKYCLAVLLFGLGCFLILRKAWVSEDAFITLRHVENFIDGWGPVFNVNERVEGFTHPLWFAVVSLFRKLGLSPKGAVIVPGLLASFSALYILFFRFRPSWGTGSSPMLNPGAAILIGTSAFIDFGTSGLETALSYLLLILYAKFLAEGRWKDQPLAMGLIVALLTLNRPDFVVFMIFLFCFYVYGFLKRRIPFKQMAQYLIFPLILVGGYQIFRMGYYAALFPNPFYAKSGSASHISQGVRYLWDLFQGSLLSIVLIAAILALLLNLRQGRGKNQALLFLSGLLHGFFVIRGGGDFMHGRFLLPAFLLITASITGSFDRFFEKKTSLKKAYIGICLILLYLSLHTVPVQLKGRYYNYGISNERYAYYRDTIIPLKYLFTDTVIIMWKNIGKNYQRLARQAKLNLRVAYKNVGFTGYYAGNRVYVVDQLGLTDPVISRAAVSERGRPGHEKHAPLGYLFLRELTFHETPFLLWNEIAETKYGILWDLSPQTLEKLSFFLTEDFKSNIDIRIVDFLGRLNETNMESQSDFLFFLKLFWFPHAAPEEQKFFLQKYQEEVVSRHAASMQWIHNNESKVSLLFSHIQGPLNLKRIGENMIFALMKHRVFEF